MDEYPLNEAVAAAGGRMIEINGLQMPADYGDIRAEYQAAVQTAVVYDARNRGLIEVVGSDRACWLHNLVTNSVKTLRPGDGCYAFAANAKGRILFDCNILVHEEAIWLDIDRRLVAKALAHLERYHVAEDVRLTDRSDEYCRVGLLGPRASELTAALTVTKPVDMSSLGSTSVTLAGKVVLMVRHDFAGLLGMEFYIGRDDAKACWQHLLESGRPFIRPIGRDAMEVLRIEAGIPAYGQDIDEDVLPAETGQAARAISYVKGCYLGQEIVERMHARGVQAKSLVGLRLSANQNVHPGAGLNSDDTNVGRITSICESFAVGGKIALGYVKTPYSSPGKHLRIDATASIDAEVVSLPFR